MFARKSCYCFVRPKRSYLEVCIFLGRPVNAPQVRQIVQSSRYKRAHLLRIRHRDEVEPPLTDWLREAYDYNVAPVPLRAAVAPDGPPRSARTRENQKPVATTQTTAKAKRANGTLTKAVSTRTKKRRSLTRPANSR
jgi:hypothetical protein